MLHALLGCCIHHDHCSTQFGLQRVAEAQQPSRCCGHGCHTPVSQDDSQNDDDHQNGDQCDEPNCSFAFEKRVDDLDLNSLAVDWLASMDGFGLSLEPAKCVGLAGANRPPDDDPLSTLPLRASSQVWRL